MSIHENQQQLHAAWKSGDDRAFAVLVESIRGLAILKAHQHYRGTIEWEDLKQAAMVGAVRAVHDFDPARGTLAACAGFRIRDELFAADHAATMATVPTGRKERRMRVHLSRMVETIMRAGISRHEAIEAAAKEIGVQLDHAEAALELHTAAAAGLDACAEFADDSHVRTMDSGRA